MAATPKPSKPRPVKAPGRSGIRVFLVDDHPIVRRGLQLLIAVERDMSVCGEAADAREALDRILSLKPDVVVVDLTLKSGSGLELIKQVRAQDARIKLLVFTMRDEGLYAERALRAGANGYITKEEGAEKTVEAIRVVMSGKGYLGERALASMATRLMSGQKADTPATACLSDRELEVLERIGRGLGTRDISEELNLSVKTIESHREHIKEKLGLSRSTALVKFAFDWLQTEGRSGGRPD